MEQTLDEEARSLLEAIWAKMLMLYAPIDGAADMLMQAESYGTYALGYGLRAQYWSMWKDWKRLDDLLDLQATEGQWIGPAAPASVLAASGKIISAPYPEAPVKAATDVPPLRAPYQKEQPRSGSQEGIS